VTRSFRSAPGDDEELRVDLRDRAARRVSEAIGDGFFIEAIALQDSMISDRLEEFLGMHKDRVTMNSLGQLAQLSRDLAPAEFTALADRILVWADHRNVAMHQMVKVGPTYHGTWDTRVEHARRTAGAGQELLRDVESAVARHRAQTR